MRKLLTLSVGLLVLAVALPAFAVEGEGRGRGGPKLTGIGGEVVRVDSSSITVGVKMGRERDAKIEEKTFTLDAKVKVLIESDEDEVVKGRGEGGNERKRPKIVDGTTADLKAGKRVVVTVADDKTATSILVPRAPAPRAGREGEKKKEAAPSTPRKSEKERERN